MPSHKRTTADRETTYSRPRCECFACYDSGIIANGDLLLSRFLPDYDTLPNGTRMTGSDTAIVCHCNAAMDRLQPDGQPASRGQRLASGDLLVVTTDAGPRFAGAEIPREHAREIHRQRLEAWRQTEAAMTEARRSRAEGDPNAAPWFITELRSLLQSPRRPSAAASDATHAEDTEGTLLDHAGASHGLSASQRKAREMVHHYDARVAAGEVL